ncbi:MAG: TerB family tellurite resistance protein [Gammaproteobacteria bacterium]|nr:MAG: TerB family tellurite resistance protein [Gammaproteobacteria bacterium]RLA61825.1 MAG: TerB family tellurite resistance protein [Gammaproteobacteria bacterium]
MIAALKALFESPARESEESQRQRLQLVAAALLIETARADFIQDAAEQAALEELLSGSLQLDKQEVRELMVLAENRADEATSLYEFTRVINDYYSAAQKLQLISAMWVVAYADGNLDKYEEHLIRQVAELTYVTHQDYIQCKLAAKS